MPSSATCASARSTPTPRSRGCGCTRGRLTDSGIAQAVRRRGQLVGIAGLHPHDLRHAWMHHMDRAGASRETLMAIGGWSSDAMLRRYASSTGNERAIEHATKIGLGDKL
jgi:integrase